VAIGGKREPVVGYFTGACCRSIGDCQASAVRGRPLKRALVAQYGPNSDRIKLTKNTLSDACGNLAAVPLSLDALRRNRKSETSRREQGQGSVLSISEALTPESGGWARCHSVQRCVVLLPWERMIVRTIRHAPTLGQGSGRSVFLKCPDVDRNSVILGRGRE
jgi:hypothetical protein